MSVVALVGRSRWLVAGIGAITITVTLAFLFRVPTATIALPSPSSASIRPAVKMANADEADLLLKQEAELRDLRPLFLPTQRNAALPEPRLEPGRTFLENETLKLTFPDAEVLVSKDLPPLVLINGKPAEAAQPLDALAADATAIPLEGFGRGQIAVQPITPRGGCIEVIAAEDGRHVWTAELPVSSGPPGEKPWTPVEFLAVVDAAGLTSPLVVTDSSRVEEVDVYFRNFLSREFRIGHRLPPGFYRITVAP
jgi:hypothetical protein